MWVRGLKPFQSLWKFFEQQVAPHLGAWIETAVSLDMSKTYG